MAKNFPKIIIVALLMLVIAGCSTWINKNPTNSIMDRFDGYNWSWKCGEQEFNFTLWKQNMDLVKPSSSFWLILGSSSDRNDQTKSVSKDESGRIFIIYSLENDTIINQIHGKQVPTIPDINKQGKILNKNDVTYCK